MASGLFYIIVWSDPLSILGVSGWFLLPCFIEILVFNANSVDSVASDLGLHCLPMSFLWEARLEWVKKSKLQNW